MRPLLVLAGVTGLAFAQSPSLTLGTKNASVTEPFSALMGLAELPDGRVVVSDREEGKFFLVDFRTGNRTVIGRNGIGPNEYQVPFGPIRWRGDTLMGYDPQNRRFIKIGPDGAIAGMMSFPAARPGGITSWSVPRGVDPEGRMYYDTPIILRQPAIKRSRFAMLVRLDPDAASLDSVMSLQDHAEFEHEFRYRPMPQTDAWVMAPDGRVGILSAAEYRLRWYRDGQVVETGPPIPFTPVPVTTAEKEAFWTERAAEPASGASPTGTPMQRRRQSLEQVKRSWPDSLFPRQLPPFRLQGALLAPNGDVWVKRTVPATSPQQQVDILGPTGRLKATLRLPPRTDLFALGSGGVYLVSTDDDGLQTLERYAYPVLPR